MISLIINTCALASHADDVYGSWNKAPHAHRAFALRNFILPEAVSNPDYGEVIVVGEWEPGEGYTYIPFESKTRTALDCIAKRQAGFEASEGTWLIFQHDDHWLENDTDSERGSELQNALNRHYFAGRRYCVIVPSRWTRLRGKVERLNNGEARECQKPEECYTPTGLHSVGYISGHCAIYHRKVLEECPWSGVPAVHTLDVEHTKQIRAAGFPTYWEESLRVFDVEQGGTPWQ